MKPKSNSGATLKFNTPEIKVGLDAAKAAGKPAMASSMPKDKKMIMSKSPAPKPKRIPKRK
jgi:hypothetical protein